MRSDRLAALRARHVRSGKIVTARHASVVTRSIPPLRPRHAKDQTRHEQDTQHEIDYRTDPMDAAGRHASAGTPPANLHRPSSVDVHIGAGHSGLDGARPRCRYKHAQHRPPIRVGPARRVWCKRGRWNPARCRYSISFDLLCGDWSDGQGPTLKARPMMSHPHQHSRRQNGLVDNHAHRRLVSTVLSIRPLLPECCAPRQPEHKCGCKQADERQPQAQSDS